MPGRRRLRALPGTRQCVGAKAWREVCFAVLVRGGLQERLSTGATLVASVNKLPPASATGTKSDPEMF